ncbi:MAG: hypothetical protein ABW252_14785 [Polyangiales bacterium]
MDRFATRALIFSLGLVALGCDDLSLDDEQDAKEDAGIATPGSDGATATNSAARELTVDATDREAWTFLDLDTGTQDKSEAAVAGWDVAIQRSNLRLKPRAQAALVAGASFESVTEAPREGWGSDVTAADGKTTYFLSSGETTWYDYDGSTHVLTPKPNVYVVQTDGGHQKLAVLAWANEAGTPAVYRLKVGKVAAPRGPISERDAEVDVSTSASRAADAGTDSGN